MPRRSKEWDETLQKELRKPKFAKAYIEAAIKDGLPIQVALAQVIKAMGVVEYAEKVGMHSQNIHRLLKPGTNPTLETLNELLAPLGLAMGIVERTSKKRAA